MSKRVLPAPAPPRDDVIARLRALANGLESGALEYVRADYKPPLRLDFGPGWVSRGPEPVAQYSVEFRQSVTP